jgi:hypothetical protein
MAIIELAKIQVRRGQENVTGEPTLSPGEFGWAQDTEHLWIGKSIGEGAPDNLNTRILTENDLFSSIIVGSTSTFYQYQGHIPGYAATATIVRTVAGKLDDTASALDFGFNNTSTAAANQSALQAAVDSLYRDSSLVGGSYAADARAVIHIPAGTYNVNGPIYLPPYVSLSGEGSGKTLLTLANTSVSLFQLVGVNPSTGSRETFVPGFTNVQAGHQPRYIHISDITIQYSTASSTAATLPLVRVDCATDTVIERCQFQGAFNVGASATSYDTYAGIEVRGQGALTTKGLIIQDCTFNNLCYGIKSGYDMQDAVISNCEFDELNRGVVYCDSLASGNFTGPVRTRLVQNRFNDIEREGFYVGDNGNSLATNHISSYNVFTEVGNNINGDSNPVTPVINFLSPGNISSGDYIDRFRSLNSGTITTSTVSLGVGGSAYVDSEVVYSSAISSATVTLARFPFNGSEQSLSVKYNILKPASAIARKGELLINSSILSGTPTAEVTDTYRYTGSNDGNLVFSATLNTGTNAVVLSYTSSDSIGTISYKYSQLQ